MSDLLELVKQSLGIVSTATAKDTELKMLIQAGLDDMARAGVDVPDITELGVTIPALIKRAVVTYVKANFGISNPTDKEKFLHSYQLVLAELSLSENYKEVEDAGLNN